MVIEQLTVAIEKAKTEVAEQGYEGADLRQVMLAGFGYLGDKLEESGRGVIRIQVSGKRFFAIGVGIGGVVVGVVQAVLHLV